MRYRSLENKRQFKNRAGSARTAEAAGRLGMSVRCRGEELEIVVCRRGKAPQYAFRGEMSGEENCEIEGEIELVGRPWRWYDYALTALTCVIFLPLTLLLVAGDLVILSSIAAGNPLRLGIFPFPFTSAKGREKKLNRFLTQILCLERVEG